MQDGTCRTSCYSGIIVKFWRQFVFYIATARTHQDHLQVQQKCAVTMRHLGNRRDPQKKIGTKIKRRTTTRQLETACRIFQNLEDAETPPTANISHDSDPERPTKVAPRKHSTFYSHLPKDRSCEVCLRTKMTRGPCRKRTGEAVPRAEKFGDLIRADHKVLFNEEGESRNNHRYAVVAQALATHWLILGNAIAICEMSKTSWKMGKLSMKGDSENHRGTRSGHSRRNLEERVRFCHGITELQHFIDLVRMETRCVPTYRNGCKNSTKSRG